MGSTTISKDFTYTEVDGIFADDTDGLNDCMYKLVKFGEDLKKNLYVTNFYIGEQSFYYKEKYGMAIFEEEMRKTFTPLGKKKPTKSAKTLLVSIYPFLPMPQKVAEVEAC